MTLLAVATCAAAWAQTTRVSVDSAGTQGVGPSSQSSISADGRFVAFLSDAQNLVAGGGNGKTQVYVHDRQTGITTCASLGPTSAPGNDHCATPSISGNGNLIAFRSLATDLVSGDTNSAADVFVRDVAAGTTRRVSISSTGAQGDALSEAPAISADGSCVTFQSAATNLVLGDTNGVYDVFVHELATGTTTRASVSSASVEGDSDSGFQPRISGDGRFVAFGSNAANLVIGDVNQVPDIFVHDRQTGLTELVSVDSAGAHANNASFGPALSANGRVIAFQSNATNLAGLDTNAATDVFVRDTLLGVTMRASVDSAGFAANSFSVGPALSADGRLVAFQSIASNLVAGDTNGTYDIFVHDRLTSQTLRVSLGPAAVEGNGNSRTASISATGRYVSFESTANNLVAGDTNAALDVFVVDRGAFSTGTPYCFGDGTGTACPCANSGWTGNGCGSSTFASGANLEGSGLASVSGSAPELVLTVTNMAGPGLFFQGTGQYLGGLGFAFGDGILCVNGTLARLAVVFPSFGTAVCPDGPGAPSIFVAGAPLVAGDVRNYQVWYRDAFAFCAVQTFNLTQGLTITWIP